MNIILKISAPIALLFAQFSIASEFTCREALSQRMFQNSPAITNSLRYKALEDLNSDEAKELIQQSATDLQRDLIASKNITAVKKWIWDLHSGEKVVRSEPNGFSLIDHGFGKTMELVQKNSDGTTKSLFSTKNRDRLQSFRVNPNKKYVAVSWYRKGSIDDYFIQIINTETGATTNPEQVSTGGKAIFQWADNETLFIETHSPRLHLDKIFAPTGERSLAYDQAGSLAKRNNYLFFSRDEATDILINTLTKEASEVPLHQANLLGSLPSGDLVLRKENEESYEFYVYSPKSKKVTSFLNFKDEVLLFSFISADKLFIYSEKSALRTLSVLEMADLAGATLQKIQVPIEFTINDVEFDSQSKIITLSLASPLQEKLKTQFKLGAKPNFSTPRKLAMQGKNFKARTKILHVQTEDGWDLPVRLVFNSETQMNGNNPVIMPAYGGFNLPGYFEPTFKVEYDQFLQAGGVLAFPVIRGGSELGQAGHKAAQGARHLATSAKDLIAVAKALVKTKVTSSKKIIIQGTSNGGRLVATAALMSPESFGMAISINGVHDLLAKEYLDSKNDLGWSHEYGNSNFVEDYPFVDHLSNVEAPFASEVNIFVVGGRNDTRVNPAHSLKLYASLKGQSYGGVRLLSLNNAGHWMESPSYQGVIGWWTETMIWTKIFDFLGMSI